jgi:hypothetical protein
MKVKNLKDNLSDLIKKEKEVVKMKNALLILMTISLLLASFTILALPRVAGAYELSIQTDNSKTTNATANLKDISSLGALVTKNSHPSGSTGGPTGNPTDTPSDGSSGDSKPGDNPDSSLETTPTPNPGSSSSTTPTPSSSTTSTPENTTTVTAKPSNSSSNNNARSNSSRKVLAFTGGNSGEYILLGVVVVLFGVGLLRTSIDRRDAN